MKKLLIALLICCCVSPLYAQRGRRFFSWKKPATFSRVQAALSRNREKITPVNVSHIQITNLPKQPIVKLGAPLPRANDTKMPAMLSARMLSGREGRRRVFPGETLLSAMYLPTVLNTQENVMFRGLRLYDLKSVKNILVKGMRYKDVSAAHAGKVFFSGWLFRVADFATSALSDEQALPVIVKFAIPSDERTIYAKGHMFSMDYYYWREDIRVSDIQDVMVFLEVDGKPDWYKATLEDGELVFTPTTSRVFSNNELIYHELPATRCKHAFGE